MQGINYATIRDTTFEDNQINIESLSETPPIDGPLSACPDMPNFNKGLGGTIFAGGLEQLEARHSSVKYSKALYDYDLD